MRRRKIVTILTVGEAVAALVAECPRRHNAERHQSGFCWHGTAQDGELRCMASVPMGSPGIVPTWTQIQLLIARRERAGRRNQEA